jgi:4-amino-4-deoxy-L-arabinose transferase-like glycosyltransferase
MQEGGTGSGLSRQGTSWRAVRSRWLPLAAILAGGAALRLYGLNWDGGQWLHPDERQIYFVALGLGWPESLAQALSPASPLNPGFFAYGSLPIYLLRLAAGLLAPFWPAAGDPDALQLVGRPLAALFDLGTVLLAYRLARQWGAGQAGGFLAAALTALAVVHVQAAHFYTADVLLTFLVMLALSLAIDVARGAGPARQAALGVAVGLALGTKVAAAPLLLLVPAAYTLRARREPGAASRYLLPAAGRAFLVLLLAALTFVLVQPYALLDWQTFLGDTLREAEIAWGRMDAPYTRQYAGTVPYLYPAWQVGLWGLGLPVGLAAWAALAAVLVRWLRRGAGADTLVLVWAVPYLLVTGLLYAKPLRYALPLVPVLCAAVASALAGLGYRRAARMAGWGLAAAALAYALLFARIYAEAHPWIAASAWVYDRVPAGSTLAVEEWDMALPLPLAQRLEGQARRIEEYRVRVLPVYDEPDDEAKWQALAAELAQADYVVIASRRAYGALTRLAERYPVTGRYYEALFSGELGFVLDGEFSRGPEWLNPRVPPLPGAAPRWLLPDESLVVYDHPRAMLWRNAERLPAEELLRRLTASE